ncbi:MAG: TldD/PmbA family protein [Myxococcota bacterium]|nr:TldD/PmbA family protein [Myxococcota bacterium]
MNELIQKAERANQIALELGANEVEVLISQQVSTEMSQRKGTVEKSQQSNTMSMAFSLLVDDRFSTHSISDTRPEAIKPFLKQAIEATRYLEPDSNRRLPNIDWMGVAEKPLNLFDATQRTPQERKETLNQLEALALEKAQNEPLRSITVGTWDVRSSGVTLCSNGYQAQWEQSQFGNSAEITLVDPDGRLPEASTYYVARHFRDVPSHEHLVNDLIEKGRKRLQSSAINSEKLPMLLENRVAARMLRPFLNALRGSEVYEKRSCFKDKIGQQVAASGLQITSDPLIPKALGSSYFDGDGLASRTLPILVEGVLQNFFISIYNSRRLQMPHTSSQTGNIVIPAGDQTEKEILAALPRAIRVEGFLGGNSNITTGDFSYGISGTLFENGEKVQGISEMNVSGNLLPFLKKWLCSANNPWVYSSYRIPSLLFDDMQFSGN